MKKIFTLVLVVSLLATMLVGLTGCKNGSDDEIKIWIGGSIVGEDELDKSQDSWVLSKLLKQYEDEHGVKIKLTYFEDEEAMVQLIANNERSNKEVPDFACLYSSEILRDMADTIYPLTEYLSEDEKTNILFWETVSKNGKGITEADKILGYPIGGTEVTFIAYNKEIFSYAGIDVEKKPPQTYDDFFSICEAISATGVTPIVASSDGWNELYLQVFSKRWVQYSGDAAIISMAKGENAFSDDKNLIDSLTIANDYYKRGFINKDYATNNDAITLFSNGKGAMFSCSNYDLNLLRNVMGNNLGVFILPDYTDDSLIYPHISFGGCNQCFSVFNSSKNKEEAINIIKWLSTKENSILMAQQFGCIPNRVDVTLEEYDSSPDAIISKIYPLLPYAHSTPDYLMPMKVYTEFYRYSEAVVIGDMTPSDFAKKMDEIVYA